MRVVTLVTVCVALVSADVYQVGIGMGDVTGPAAEVNMMGYANPTQTTEGIHLRMYSRAFIFSDGKTRVAFASVDIGMMSQAVKDEVIKRLKMKHGNLYNEKNVALSGTHSHSGTAGFLQYVLFQVTSLGFVWESFEPIVQGIFESIDRAHVDMRDAKLFLNEGELLEANINRSPSAYLLNPREERARYKYNVEKTMHLVKIAEAESGNHMGSINWFPVHGTSMNNTNKLISGDNKGIAGQLFERHVNGKDVLPGTGSFVAAFAQSHLGDVSPNTKGARCQTTGLPCDVGSTCDGKSTFCIASGPGKDMKESTKIIGEKQFEKALELYEAADKEVSGPVRFIHQYADMTNQNLFTPDGRNVTTCKPAMGYSFAAGTTDGPGMGAFSQGTTEGSAFWNAVSGLLAEPTEELKACQAPKPILLATGEVTKPYEWQPSVIEVQILQVGNLIILPFPGELTTMSGRRLIETVRKVYSAAGEEDLTIVIGGLSNVYSDYITTYEEYHDQRYEGASTIYGPHTLFAYQNLYEKLAVSLLKNEDVAPGPTPPNLLNQQWSLLPKVFWDSKGPFDDWGELLHTAPDCFPTGATLALDFVAANPRNDVMHDSTFLTVDQQQTDGSWVTKYTDASWETEFHWRRVSLFLGSSEVTIKWEVPEDQELGVYRVCHYGHYKELFQKPKPYGYCTLGIEVKKSCDNDPVDDQMPVQRYLRHAT